MQAVFQELEKELDELNASIETVKLHEFKSKSSEHNLVNSYLSVIITSERVDLSQQNDCTSLRTLTLFVGVVALL